MSGLDDLTREELIELVVKPYLKVKTAPQRVLAERMAGFIGELFTFVAKVQVPSENDAAERAIRPAVVARKWRKPVRARHEDLQLAY